MAADPNGIDIGEALKALGDEGHRIKLSWIVAHLARSSEDFKRQEWSPRPLHLRIKRARYAPSIVTRGEAELFGVSTPRFAIRLYLESGGFANCRRLLFFAEHVERHGQTYTRVSQEALPPLRDLLMPANASLPLLADSLFPPPPFLQSDPRCRFIATDLFREYGEAAGPLDQHGNPTPMLPFVESLEFAGGLCSQAVCYMATAILLPFASAVYGLGEITALAQPIQAEIPLRGLDSIEMSHYFAQVGLRFTEQAAEFPELQGDDALPLERRRRASLSQALRAYLGSDIPIIFPTDVRRLATTRFRCGSSAGLSIYKRNGWLTKTEFPDAGNAHSIILVGYRPGGARPATVFRDQFESENGHQEARMLSEDEREDEYVFHDPAVSPYLLMSLSELMEVSCDEDGAEGLHYRGVIMPVLPKRVRLPLLETRKRDGNSVKYYAGLFFILAHIGQIVRDEERLSEIPDDETRERLRRRARLGLNLEPWLLFNAAGPESMRKLQRRVERQANPALLQALLAFFAAPEDGAQGRADHWYWLEIHPEMVWIWDAQRNPLPYVLRPHAKHPGLTAILMRYLVGGVYIDYAGEPAFLPPLLTPRMQ